MQFSIFQLVSVAAAILVFGVVVGKMTGKREGDGLFARIFKDNKDFDSTLDRLCITGIIIFMLVAFHDDFGDAAKAGLIVNLFLMAFNAWQSLVLGKTVRDMQRNGQR